MAKKKTAIRKCSESFIKWCADTSPAARFERTVAQGAVGVVTGLLAGVAGAPGLVQVGVVPVVMAILAPIQAEIGRGQAEG